MYLKRASKASTLGPNGNSHSFVKKTTNHSSNVFRLFGIVLRLSTWNTMSPILPAMDIPIPTAAPPAQQFSREKERVRDHERDHPMDEHKVSQFGVRENVKENVRISAGFDQPRRN